MAKISDFVSLVRDGGLAKTSHFTIVLNLPQMLLTSPYVEKKNKIITFCDQVQIPGVNFASSQVRSYGEFREVPYEKIYEPITMSFYADTKMVTKNLFDDWMNLIQNTNTRDFNYPSDYTTDTIQIHVQDAEETTNYIVILNECYPKSVSAITLDYASKDIMKINVTMIYKYMMYFRTDYSIKGTNYADELFQAANDFTYGYDLRAAIPAVQDQLTGIYSRVSNTIDGARSIVTGIDRMLDVF